MLWESCSSSHTEHNKISFAIFGFLYDFIGILQGSAQGVKVWLLVLRTGPWISQLGP
jgi:hypothetical protein